MNDELIKAQPRNARTLSYRSDRLPVPAYDQGHRGAHAGERPAARACAAGLALLTMRAAEGAAKVNRCRETAR